MNLGPRARVALTAGGITFLICLGCSGALRRGRLPHDYPVFAVLGGALVVAIIIVVVTMRVPAVSGWIDWIKRNFLDRFWRR